ncbi:S-adenosylmethionine decarboxylase [Dyella sp. 20L07]|uniref:S-adenosylmethionine decarboxylase n=1 Tax=Dyella sp. 20L07 TaxID=3384240 RepID=UPI003D2B9412
MNSMHFLGEWFDCRASLAALRDPAAIRALCVEHVMRHRVAIAYDFFTISAREGVIGAVMADDLHIVVRTFPDRDAMNIDLYADQHRGSDAATVFQVLSGLCDDFKPARTVLHRVQHGVDATPTSRAPIAPTQAFAATRWQAA